jgi:fructose-1,6-bisphosphatase II / sedoheptulose-1,7-bisphosphatase
MTTDKHSNIILHKLLHFDVMNVTSAAAMASYSMIGMGDENEADQMAVSAMRLALDDIDIDGTVVIGEGERDNAPMLFIGENVGNKNGPAVDLALDPLEGTTTLATGGRGALSVLALAPKGCLLYAPDTYMDKIAVGIDASENIVDVNESPLMNLRNISQFKKCNIEDLMVVILDRPRHMDLIDRVRSAGARISLIRDGDVAAVIAAANGEIDAYMGIGGAPEGVLAAAALCTLGGQMSSKLVFRNDDERQRAILMGITDFDRVYNVSDMARDDVIFVATGITDGNIVDGVRIFDDHCETHSIVMRSSFMSISLIKTKFYM